MDTSSKVRQWEYQALERERKPSQYTETLKENRRDVQGPRQNLKWHTEERAGDSQHHTERQVCATAASLLLTVSLVMKENQKNKMVSCLLGATGRWICNWEASQGTWKTITNPQNQYCPIPTGKKLSRTNFFGEYLQTSRYLYELQGHQVSREGVKKPNKRIN